MSHLSAQAMVRLLQGATLLLSISAHAEVSSVREYLQNTLRSELSKRMRAQADEVTSLSGNVPIISDIEVYGGQTRERGEDNKNKLGLKVHVRGVGESSAGTALKHASDRQTVFEVEQILARELLRKYRALVEASSLLKRRTLEQELAEIAKVQLETSRRQIRASLTQPKSLVASEAEAQKVRIALARSDRVLASRLQELGLPRSSPLLSQIPEPQALRSHVAEELKVPPVPVLVQEIRHEIARADADLATGEDRRYLKTLEAGTDWKGNNQSYFLEVTFKLPFLQENATGVAAKRASAVVEEAKLGQLKQETQERLEALRKEVLGGMDDFVQLSASDSFINLKKYVATLSQARGVDPSILLNARAQLAEQQLALLKLSDEIYGTYLDYLFVSGKLSQAPLRNLLSPSGEEL